MKISLLASAAASVLVFAVAAPAFADDVVGYVDVTGGYDRNHNAPTGGNLTNTAPVGVAGAAVLPVGGFGLQVEGTYVDTGRKNPTDNSVANLQGYKTQELGAASVFQRNDMWAYGATVGGGQIGEFSFSKANPTSPFTPTVAVDNLTTFDGSVFVEKYGDKYDVSARASYGNIDGEETLVGHIAPVGITVAGAPGKDVSVSDHYADASIDGKFFLTDNAFVFVDGDYRDLEGYDPVIGESLGVELKMPKTPFGAVAAWSGNRFGNTFAVGVVASFGAGSLADLEKKGPVDPYINPLKMLTSMFITGGSGKPH